MYQILGMYKFKIQECENFSPRLALRLRVSPFHFHGFRFWKIWIWIIQGFQKLNRFKIVSDHWIDQKLDLTYLSATFCSKRWMKSNRLHFLKCVFVWYYVGSSKIIHSIWVWTIFKNSYSFSKFRFFCE